MEVVSVDLDITTNRQVSWCDEVIKLINVLVLSSLKVRSLDDAGVLLFWLVDRDRVISQVEGDNESSLDVLRHPCVESCGVSQDLFVIINKFEEINLRFLWNQIVDISEGILLVSKSVVGWNLNVDWVSWFWVLNT